MSTPADEQAAIMGHIRSNWTETEIAFPNTAFDPDEDAAHIRPVVRRQTAFNASVAKTSRRVRHPGLLVIEVRQRENTGDDRVMDYGSSLKALFENLQLAPGIHFKAATVRDMGPDGRGWYVAQVECPYWRDSTN
jgi:hypothetical protein